MARSCSFETAANDCYFPAVAYIICCISDVSWTFNACFCYIARCTLADLMSRADPPNAISWKNLSPVSRHPGTAIPGSMSTRVARL